MVARTQITAVTPESLHLDALPERTGAAFLRSLSFEFLAAPTWYLAGGTALALQVGHRQSVDLDFFSTEAEYNENAVEGELVSLGDWVTTAHERGTIFGELDGAKISFLAYPFFRPSGRFLQCGTLRILLPQEIAAMKILAMSQRGRRRDFVDLYWYCKRHESLGEVIRRALRQFPGKNHNVPHIIKSLAYFKNAEEDPMPKLFFPATWGEIRAFFEKEAVKAAKQMAGI